MKIAAIAIIFLTFIASLFFLPTIRDRIGLHLAKQQLDALRAEIEPLRRKIQALQAENDRLLTEVENMDRLDHEGTQDESVLEAKKANITSMFVIPRKDHERSRQ